MVDVRRLPVEGNDEVAVTLDELAKEGARRMIAAALEAEVEQYVAAFVKEIGEDGKRLGARVAAGCRRRAQLGCDHGGEQPSLALEGAQEPMKLAVLDAMTARLPAQMTDVPLELSELRRRGAVHGAHSAISGRTPPVILQWLSQPKESR